MAVIASVPETGITEVDRQFAGLLQVDGALGAGFSRSEYEQAGLAFEPAASQS
jgi:hypothetical protein